MLALERSGVAARPPLRAATSSGPRCRTARGGTSAWFPVAMAAGKHPFPFRTRQLSPPAPMVLGGRPPGRVGRRRDSSEQRVRATWRGPFVVPATSFALRGSAVPPTYTAAVERTPRRDDGRARRSPGGSPGRGGGAGSKGATPRSGPGATGRDARAKGGATPRSGPGAAPSRGAPSKSGGADRRRASAGGPAAPRPATGERRARPAGESRGARSASSAASRRDRPDGDRRVGGGPPPGRRPPRAEDGRRGESSSPTARAGPRRGGPAASDGRDRRPPRAGGAPARRDAGRRTDDAAELPPAARGWGKVARTGARQVQRTTPERADGGARAPSGPPPPMDRWVRTDEAPVRSSRSGDRPARGAGGSRSTVVPVEVDAEVRRAAGDATAAHRETLVRRLHDAAASYQRHRDADALRLAKSVAREVPSVAASAPADAEYAHSVRSPQARCVSRRTQGARRGGCSRAAGPARVPFHG